MGTLHSPGSIPMVHLTFLLEQMEKQFHRSHRLTTISTPPLLWVTVFLPQVTELIKPGWGLAL